MIEVRGLGIYVNPSSVATDAQAASAPGDSFVHQLPVGTIDYRGDFEVLTVNGSQFSYDDAGIVPANVLSSQGISLLATCIPSFDQGGSASCTNPNGTQQLNNAKSVALLNALQGPAGGAIADVQGAAFSALDSVISGSQSGMLIPALVVAAIVLALVVLK